MRPDGTKDQILPALLDADANGVFHTHPKHPYYLAKCRRDPDKRPHAPLVDPSAVSRETPMEELQRLGQEIDAAPAKKVRKPSAFNLMQKQAKELGINGWGMKQDDLRKSIQDEINRRSQTGD